MVFLILGSSGVLPHEWITRSRFIFNTFIYLFFIIFTCSDRWKNSNLECNTFISRKNIKRYCGLRTSCTHKIYHNTFIKVICHVHLRIDGPRVVHRGAACSVRHSGGYFLRTSSNAPAYGFSFVVMFLRSRRSVSMSWREIVCFIKKEKHFLPEKRIHVPSLRWRNRKQGTEVFLINSSSRLQTSVDILKIICEPGTSRQSRCLVADERSPRDVLSRVRKSRNDIIYSCYTRKCLAMVYEYVRRTCATAACSIEALV